MSLYTDLRVLLCLQFVHYIYIDHPYISYILQSYYHIAEQSKIVSFCFIPRHIGINRNEEADNIAKSELEF